MLNPSLAGQFAALSGIPASGGIFTGAITLPAGSAPAPSLNFAGSTTTGLYAASNSLFIAANGAAVAQAVSTGTFLVYGYLGIQGGNGYISVPAANTIRFSDVNDVMQTTQLLSGTVASGSLGIAKADIIGTSAGQLGHANGVPIVVSPGAGYAIEFISGVVILDFATAAYTGGGNVSFTYDSGGATLSNTVTFANSVGGSADKIALVYGTTPTNNQLTANKGINLVCAGAPTDPGTAAGVLRVRVTYRIHTTGL